MKYVALTTFFLLVQFACFAQRDVPKKAKKLFQEAKQLVKIEQNGQAIPLLQKAIKKHSTYESAFVYLAEAYEKTGETKLAIKAYDDLLSINKNLASKVLSSKANLYLRNGFYALAETQFEQYVNLSNLKEKNKIKAKAELVRVKQLIEMKSDPVPFNPVSLGNMINSNQLEYLPSLTADEQTIVFTKKINDGNIHEDFYISYKDDNTWSKPLRLKSINTPGDEGAQSIAADGKTIFFAASDRLGGYGNFDIWMAKKKGDYWDDVQNLGPNINTTAYESQPSISADGTTLFFCSKGRSDAIGGYDLYKSKWKDGKWSRAELLDSTINTVKNEVCPFIHHDGQTLYFGSDGHLGFGDEDLFKSELVEGEWTKPQNLGYPINTHHNESSLVIGATGKQAYFSSDRKNGEGGLDIYTFELPEIIKPKPITYFKGVIKDAATKQPLEAQIELFDLATNQLVMNSISDENDGTFLTILKADKNYACNVSKDSYLFHSEHFTFTTNPEGKPYVMEILLRSIPKMAISEIEIKEKPTQKVVLNNIFFDSGKAELLPTSTLELDRLVQLLTDHPNLKIQVNGHTDDVGSEIDNMILSENRAKSVVNYLLLKGIEPERLKYKGFGETQPLDKSTAKNSRALNRRTEFEIISTGGE